VPNYLQPPTPGRKPDSAAPPSASPPFPSRPSTPFWSTTQSSPAPRRSISVLLFPPSRFTPPFLFLLLSLLPLRPLVRVNNQKQRSVLPVLELIEIELSPSQILRSSHPRQPSAPAPSISKQHHSSIPVLWPLVLQSGSFQQQHSSPLALLHSRHRTDSSNSNPVPPALSHCSLLIRASRLPRPDSDSYTEHFPAFSLQ